MWPTRYLLRVVDGWGRWQMELLNDRAVVSCNLLEGRQGLPVMPVRHEYLVKDMLVLLVDCQEAKVGELQADDIRGTGCQSTHESRQLLDALLQNSHAVCDGIRSCCCRILEERV